MRDSTLLAIYSSGYVTPGAACTMASATTLGLTGTLTGGTYIIGGTFKFLDAAAPLSVQVHPTLAAIERLGHAAVAFQDRHFTGIDYMVSLDRFIHEALSSWLTLSEQGWNTGMTWL
ncbi:MAG: hypothetical protein HC794_01240, partial [Nitrospiraceae bacterium]|nr:hypothetical protein [Nitrospiraceae bacterium]